MSAKVCPACQKKFFDGSVFCDNCGTQLVDEQPEYQPPVNQQPPVYAQPPVNQPLVYGQPYAQPAYAPVVMVKPRIPGRGLGIASMILGIIGIVYGFSAMCVSIVFNDEFSGRLYRGFYSSNAISEAKILCTSVTALPLILGMLSLVFAFVSIGKGYKRGQSISGLVLSIITLIFVIVSFILIGSF